jgi:integrase
MRASGLISLGAGAGLLAADLRMLRGTDVTRVNGAVIVSVSGSRQRLVPVRAEFSGRVFDAAQWAGDRFVIGGKRPDRRNLTTRLADTMAGGADLDRLNLSRLRSTWLVSCAADIGLVTFMAAAGIRCSQRLGDLAAYLDPGDLEKSIEVLGARC